MSAHTQAALPSYLERELAAQLEKLGVAADSEEGQAAREKVFERRRNKLQAARLRRAAKKAVESPRAKLDSAEPVAEPAAEKKDDETTPSSPSTKSLATSQKPRVSGSAASPAAPEASSAPTSEPVAPKSSRKRKRGTRSATASSPDTSSSTA